MKVLTEENLPLKEETVCTIGNFDGFHKGHRFILDRVIESSKRQGKSSLVITFEPHPKTVLSSGEKPCRITGLETKIDLLEDEGIDYLYIINFSREFARKDPEEFIKFLTEKLRCRTLIVGHDWKFGHQGKGDVQTAKQIGRKYGLKVEVIPPVKEEDKRISSTQIRNLLKKGKVEEVARYLGRDYCIKGKVEQGNRIGSQIGFPTINIKPPEDLCLKKGVYSGLVKLNGQLLPAVINYGNRPTVDGRETVLEAHIIGKKLSFKPEEVKIFFKKFIRDEKRFSDIDQLKNQIKADIQKAMKSLEVLK
ncbi:bifunctional riboflavin kinase/FAD synthetase [Persephonella sp.]